MGFAFSDLEQSVLPLNQAPPVMKVSPGLSFLSLFFFCSVSETYFKFLFRHLVSFPKLWKLLTAPNCCFLHRYFEHAGSLLSAPL